MRRWISENSTAVDGSIGVLHRSKVCGSKIAPAYILISKTSHELEWMQRKPQRTGGLVRRPVAVAGLPGFSAFVSIFTSWSIVGIAGQGRRGDVERGTCKKRERHEDGDGGERRDVGHAC